MREELGRRLQGKVALLGVGNPLWGDDGAGPALIRRLDGRVPALLVDAGESPESYWGKIVAYRPQAVLVVDAVSWGGEPGSVALLEEVQENGSPITTHRVSLNLLLDLLRAETGADVFVLGIQPKVVAFNTEMCPEVRRTVELAGDLVAELLAGGERW
jgi:hydrogenase 3 maturation protease